MSGRGAEKRSPATARVTGSDADPLEALRERGERFLEEVSAEYHAAHAGLKPGGYWTSSVTPSGKATSANSG